MATPMTRNAFENLTNLGLMLRGVFTDQLRAVADPNQEILSFYNVQTSTRAAERNQGMGGFGDVPEIIDTNIPYDSFELLYRSTYTHKEYAKGMAVERKLIDDDEYGAIAQRTRLMGIAFDRSIYKNAASVFNNAFTAGATSGSDGVALCSASHPYSPTNASTQANSGTLPLTHDNVIATQQAMMEFDDSLANPQLVVPDTLLVPVGLYNTALTIVGSTNKSGTANNDANTIGGLRVVVSRYLTDANNWFLIDSTMSRMYLNWFWRVRPEFALNPTSDYDLVAKARGYMRYSFGWDDWRWVYGHNVA